MIFFIMIINEIARVMYGVEVIRGFFVLGICTRIVLGFLCAWCILEIEFMVLGFYEVIFVDISL